MCKTVYTKKTASRTNEELAAGPSVKTNQCPIETIIGGIAGISFDSSDIRDIAGVFENVRHLNVLQVYITAGWRSLELFLWKCTLIKFLIRQCFYFVLF